MPQSLRRSISALVVLAVLFVLALPAATEAAPRRTPTFTGSLWSLFTAIWQKAGCIIDPIGVNGSDSIGCGMDPNGVIEQGHKLNLPGSNPAGGGYDPNGAPTSEAGAGYDPNGNQAETEAGNQFDPKG